MATDPDTETPLFYEYHTFILSDDYRLAVNIHACWVQSMNT
jgi:hypothetical protein